MGTLLSFLLGIAVIVGSVILSAEKPQVFLDVPSMLIVFGGTFAAALLSFDFKYFRAGIGYMFSAFSSHKDSSISLKRDIGQLVRWAYVIQKNGLQGLENEISSYLRFSEPFLTYGADLVITGYTGAEVRQIMEQSLQARRIKEDTKAAVLSKMASDAPAFGMFGTFIGLIVMLGGMGSDPAAIGPAMAVALITSFYGVILARSVFMPLGQRLSVRADITAFKNNLQLEGLVLLAERKSPRYIQDRINAFVGPAEQFSIDRDMREIREAEAVQPQPQA